MGSKVFSKRSCSSRSIYADVNTCQGNKACGHALAPQALGLPQKATGESHVITVESTYATILSPGMYTLSPCPVLLSRSSRKLRKHRSHKQIQNSPRTNHLPAEGRPGFMVSLGARGGSSPEGPAGPGIGGCHRSKPRYRSLMLRSSAGRLPAVTQETLPRVLLGPCFLFVTSLKQTPKDSVKSCFKKYIAKAHFHPSVSSHYQRATPPE